MRTSTKFLAGGVGALALGALLLVPGQLALSADHTDPPMRTDPAVNMTSADRAADIADIYAWHDSTNVYFALTFAGPNLPPSAAVYDRDVLYTINVSTAAPASTSEVSIPIRFAPGTGANEFGVQVANIPGTGTISGPVETILTRDGVSVFAGLRDDPFFFDSQGFRTTRDTGAIAFSNTRDAFAARNVTAVVLSIPRSRFGTGNGALDVWATGARIRQGGQTS